MPGDEQPPRLPLRARAHRPAHPLLSPLCIHRRRLQEGEGFRAACASRNHKLTLALFLAHQQLKHKPGLAWLLAQAWLLLGLLCLFLFRRLSYLCSSFATGYNRARRRGGAADSGRADSGSGRADSGGTRGGGSSGRRKK